jgi:CTP synthase
VGDIESMVYLEALRQFRYKVGNDNLCHVHVSLVPVVGATGEPKSKPTQHGVKELRAAGLSPDIIVCRSSKPLDRSVVQKISLFCMVPATHVVSVHDVSNIYKVPQLLLDQRVPYLVLNSLKLNKNFPPESLPKWQLMASRVDSPLQVRLDAHFGLVVLFCRERNEYQIYSVCLCTGGQDCDGGQVHRPG